MNNENFEYDVAFSYASEQRKYVKEIVEFLKDKNVHCFYDEDSTVQLWGHHLISSFNSIFFKKSRYCVVFLSKEYKDKMWCNHELRAALNRDLSENAQNQVYILPILCDDTTFDDILPDVAYVKINDYSSMQLADMIYSKITSNKYPIILLSDIFSDIKKCIQKKYSDVPNITIRDEYTYFSVLVSSARQNIYFFELKYFENEKNQMIRIYDSKTGNNNIGNIVSAEIYLKNQKLYLFNYYLSVDIDVGENKVTACDIKSIITDHISRYGGV